MAGLVRSLLGWREESEPPLCPPAAIITGLRIPADGSRAHLLPLSTIGDSSATDSFLIHVPDLRPYWKIDKAWELRDIHKLTLQQHDKVEAAHYSRLLYDIRKLLIFRGLGRQEQLHLRQRYLRDDERCLLQESYSSLVGVYYIFYSFAVDDLPQNMSVPTWVSRKGDHGNHAYFGDVFVVKLAACENGEDGRAIYEDILPAFLDLLDEGPASNLPTCDPEISSRPYFDKETYHTTNRDAVGFD